MNGANMARRLYAMVGRPSIKDFKGMIWAHLLKNCPITVDDIDNAEQICGPDIGALKGKTVRKASPIVTTDIIQIPQ